MVVDSGGMVKNSGDAIEYNAAAICGNGNVNVTLNSGGAISSDGAEKEPWCCFAVWLQPGTFTDTGGTVDGRLFITGTGNIFVNGEEYSEMGEAIGEIGELLSSGYDVTVTGYWSGAVDAMFFLYVPSGRTLTWAASYSGKIDLEFLIGLFGEGKFDIVSGGSITNSGHSSCTLYTVGVDVAVRGGGAVRNTGDAIDEDTVAVYGWEANVTVNGGTIAATGTAAQDLTCYALFLEDGVFTYTNGEISGVVDPKSNQTALAITNPGAITFGKAPFPLVTTGGSGTGEVVFNVESGTDVISMSGNVVTVLKTGTAIVTATKAGDDNYYPATSAALTITITSTAPPSLGGGGGGGGPVKVAEPETTLGEPTVVPAFIQGYEDNTFRGDSLITREQFVAILFRLNNAQPMLVADKENPPFKDVAVGRWSYDAIEWAKNTDIIEADEDGNFSPAHPLTRAEMAVMLVKADNLTEIGENTFTDLDGHADIDAILKAVNAKIFNGYPDGSFKPDDNSTRSEAVAALVRYLLGGEPKNTLWQGIDLSFADTANTYWAYKYIVPAVNGCSDSPF